MSHTAKPCERCGRHFSRPRGLSGTQWESRRYCSKKCSSTTRSVKDHEIINLYEAGLSSSEIGRLVGLSGVHVARILKLHISLRSRSEASTLSHSSPSVRSKISNAKLGKKCPEHVKDALRSRTGSNNHNWRSGLTMSAGGYLQFTRSEANGEHAGKMLHVVIAEWKIGRRLVPGEVVHHRDENKLNNDPDNIEVMSASDHARHHAIKREFGKCRIA